MIMLPVTEELRKLIVGPIATIPTAFNDNYEIDYGLMAAATELWIEAGLVNGRSALKVAASIGEGQCLREAELPRLLQTVVKAARGRVPVLGAIHHKDTIRTIEDAKCAADLGALAVQISPPIFNLPNQDDLLRYYGTISEKIQIGIVVYNTHWLKHGAIFPSTLARMVDFEHVVAIKWSAPNGIDYSDVFSLANRFNILDNDNDPIRCHMLGGHGYLIDGIESYPPYYLQLWDLMIQGKYEEAKGEWKRFIKPFDPFFEKVVGRSGSDAKVAKGMTKIMGMDLGPPRPPSVAMNEEELAQLCAMMANWDWPVRYPLGSV
jgi:4-hydroxy-tetrahydrodipicolinate synthase